MGRIFHDEGVFAQVGDHCDLGGSAAIGCVFGVSVVGERDMTVSNFHVRGCHVGVAVDDTKNVTIKDIHADGCKMAVTGHEATNLALLNIEIDGWKLTDFTGDFDFLTVVSADEVLHLGKMLSEADVKDHFAILKSNKLYDFLDSKGARRGATATGLIGFLISLAQCARG